MAKTITIGGVEMPHPDTVFGSIRGQRGGGSDRTAQNMDQLIQLNAQMLQAMEDLLEEIRSGVKLEL